MKTKEMLKIEATIRATESLIEWIAQSDQLSEREKEEATLKQMRQLNALIATAKNTNEKLGFWARKFNASIAAVKKLETTK
tara:strand:- start:420 stop:662 length:243 start_codon:yes stop_codon:yes gene_type:complete